MGGEQVGRGLSFLELGVTEEEQEVGRILYLLTARSKVLLEKLTGS